MPHRCAFGCKDTSTVMHVFPNPVKFPERFRAWVQLIGGQMDTLTDNEVYKKKRICDIHFIDQHRNRFKRLNALAIPTLNLPESSRSQEFRTEANHPPPLATMPLSTHATSERQPTVPTDMFSAIRPASCTSRQSIAKEEDDQKKTSIPRPSTTASDGSCSSQQPGIAVNTSEKLPSASTDPCSPIRPGQNVAATILKEHNYSVKSRPNKIKTFKDDVKTASFNYAYLRPMKKKINYLRSEICRLRKKAQSFKQRLANAEKLSNDVAFQQITKNMTKPSQLFVHMQQQAVKKAKGRRFSLEEKILSLSLFKKSPKCYRLLCKYFTLPSSKAMKRLLSQIKLSPGINPIIFEKIKDGMKEKDAPDRLCSVSFDEMSITPQISYNCQKDCLEGFATINPEKFADHVLVFMAKGVKNNFKQPIAYYFTNGLNKTDLKNLIKSVVQHALESGLIVVNTVCDQSPVNVGAITELVNETRSEYLRDGKEWKEDFFKVKGRKIIPLYDAPHIIKGLRNNLLSKDLVYTTNDQSKTIKWEYYQMLYVADKSYGELRLLDKITEEHVNPDKINKMRVKSATQVFSHSVAVATEHLTARGNLPEVCRQLIDFTLLIDKLFDSLNGSSLSIPNGKMYKGPVKRFSPHHKLWQEAKIVLKSVKFVKKVKVGDKIRLVETVIPSVTNLIKTIEGMESLWKVLSNKYGLDAMLTRNFNQDPLENFFGNIRSYGVRNIAPNTVAFEGAFKALLLNNFCSPHSRRANCEEDSSDCLQSLEFFITEKIETPDVPEENPIHFHNEICLEYNEKDAGQGNYVCGWVVKKCLSKVVKSCQQCRQILVDNGRNKDDTFIKAKEYRKDKWWLCYPSQEIDNYFSQIQNVIVSFLKTNVMRKGIKSSINTFVDILIDDPFNCAVHCEELKKLFIDISTNVIIFSWCRSINRILSGKLIYSGPDETKTYAQMYYNKHKNYKNRK